MPTLDHPSCFQMVTTDDCLIIHFTGRAPRLGQGHISLLKEFLPRALRQCLCTEVVIDFANVATLDSMTVGELVQLHQGLNSLDVHLRLRDLQPHIVEILEITQVEKLLDIQEAEFCLSAASV